MRLTGPRAYTRATPVPKMPQGLVDLMEGLTKDVLRNNPSNVYEFCANHLEKLLEIRDGPLSQKTLTLEEKISKAQEKVRQRAIERQNNFDSKMRSAANHTTEHVEESNSLPEGKDLKSSQQDIVPNLKAPVHHDQEISLSSEVEISHETTDNSLTSKDSIFDEADDSSVSKSTVIDVITRNETNIMEDMDDGIDNIPELDVNKDEQVMENEVIDDKKNKIVLDEHIELPKIEINKGEHAQEGTGNIVADQKTQISIEKIIHPFDNLTTFDEIQKNIEPSATDTSDQHVVKEESGCAVTITTCEKNASSIIVNNDVESDPKIIKKSFDEVDLIDEKCENITNENDSSNDLVSKMDLSVEVSNNNVNSTIKNKEGTVTDEIPNELAPTENLDNETEKKSGIALVNTDKTAESTTTTTRPQSVSQTVVEETTPPEPVNDDAYNIIDVNTSNNSYTENSDPKKIPIQIDETINDSVRVSDKVIIEIIKPIPTPDSMEKNMVQKESEGVNTSADEKSEVFENYSTENSAKSIINIKDDHFNDLEEKNDIDFTGDEEKSGKEENFTYIQEPDSADNNDDSSVIGSDLSKAEDDVPRDDNENGQTNMDLETAAVTIQKVFRSFLFKSRNSTFEDITNDEATSLEEDNDKNKEEYYATANKERRPLGITRMDTVLQTVNEEKSLSLSTDDSSTISSAATTIQAHVRGFLVRNRLNSYKTVSTNSLVNSNEILDTDTELLKHKTVLNIHIVPGEGLSRDESLITSMDLSLDGSPPSSINLHPLSYDLVSERRKLLKREDAIQSVSPPSNNSGKLSEDSVKEVLINEDVSKTQTNINEKDSDQPDPENVPDMGVLGTLHDQDDSGIDAEKRKRSMSSDESDVITPFIESPRSLVGDFDKTSKLIHSGEFHDVVLPTKVSRSDTTVVRGE